MAGVTCGILILLFILIVFVENPEKALYEKTVETLMTYNGLSSVQEVMEQFPELQDIQAKIKQIAYLKGNLQSRTGGPAPNLSKEGSLQIQIHAQEIHQLRRNVKEELTQLLADHAAGQP